jgi:MurNAc alpha-1-phosphate uridylyltransferase
MIFAAGEGQRMRPLTEDKPKPLVPVNGRALLDYALDLLDDIPTRKLVINNCYLGEQIRSYIDSKPLPYSVYHSDEVERLETGGGVVKVLDELEGKPFFALNADTICLNAEGKKTLQSMQEFWRADMKALMLLVPVDKAVGYEGNGDVNLDADGVIIVPEDDNPRDYVFSGVQILSPGLFLGAPKGRFSLYRDWVFPQFKSHNARIEGVYGMVHQGDWLHVGTPAHVEQASNYLRRKCL